MKTSILIVSDEPQTKIISEGALGKLGPVIVHDFLTALKILKKRRFDICFVTSHLSKKADFHLLKQIQKNDGSTDLLIALEHYQVQTAMETLGSHWDYLVAPYSAKELKLKLEKTLTKRSLERENRFWRVELAALFADRGSLTLKDIPSEVWEKGEETKIEGQFLKRSRKEFERECLRGALERAHGSQTQAAKALGIHRNTLIWKLKKLNLMAECQKIVRKRRGYL
jgi:DNA-binding NtrC family response regulator